VIDHVITNGMSDYINLQVRIAHIICNHLLYKTQCSYITDVRSSGGADRCRPSLVVTKFWERFQHEV
jgi:hypothetical protein